MKNNSSSLSGTNVKIKKPFWRRQFQDEITNEQKSFDWIFGIVLPVLCFLVDPAVFKNSQLWSSQPFLGTIKPFAYILGFISITAMSAFLIRQRKLGQLNGFFSGLFLFSGLISLGMAIILLPISIIGTIIMFIGIFGFIPFFTSFVYLRNTVRAYKFAKPFLKREKIVIAMLAVSLFGLFFPSIINYEIKRRLNEMKNGDSRTVKENTNYLYYVAPITDFSPIVMYYRSKSNPQNQKALAESYKILTNRNIEEDSGNMFID